MLEMNKISPELSMEASKSGTKGGSDPNCWVNPTETTLVMGLQTVLFGSENVIVMPVIPGIDNSAF
jgi:hypothetical protein